MMSDFASGDPGERALWSGNPDPLRYCLRKSSWQALMGIPFTAFALFWISGAYTASHNAPSPLPFPFWMFGIPFVLVGLGMLLSPLWHFFRAMRTTYILTNQRAIIDCAGPFARRVSVPLDQIPFIETVASFGEFGHVLFQEATLSRYNRGFAQRDGFIAVAVPAQVERLLRTTMGKAAGARAQSAQP